MARARSLAYGRRRAARRVDAGRFAVHPGWRHRLPEGVVVLRDQALALARLEELVDAELWREDRRAVALSVLRGLVCGMAWDTGLVAGVTRAHLAAAAGCSTRTVSRIVSWAIEAGLVVCVEAGATAEFLGATSNRAPSYVLTAPEGFGGGDNLSVPPKPAQSPGDEFGNPPAYGGQQTSPRQERGLNRRHNQDPREPWPVYDHATTAAERARAVATFLDRAGLGARVPRWRAVAMLGPWFEAGWSVMGLLHAVDHHPDQPNRSRGDAARAARDPLRILGHRLSPWRGRLSDLPTALAAVDGRARRLRTLRSAEADPAARPRPDRGVASATVRAAARAELDQVLLRRRPGQQAARDRLAWDAGDRSRPGGIARSTPAPRP